MGQVRQGLWSANGSDAAKRAPRGTHAASRANQQVRIDFCWSPPGTSSIKHENIISVLWEEITNKEPLPIFYLFTYNSSLDNIVLKESKSETRMLFFPAFLFSFFFK